MSAGRPPRLSARLLRWAASRLGAPEIADSALELYLSRREAEGERVARRWYRRQARIALRRALALGFRGGSRGGYGIRLDSIVREIGLALRQVRRRPAHALTFAGVVGSGIALAAFAVQTRSDMLEPDDGLSVEAAMVVWVDDEADARPLLLLTGAEAWLIDAPPAAQGLVAIWPDRRILDTPGGIVQVGGERVLPGHLDRLGAAAWMGRDLERPGEIVLAHDLWTTRFAADPAAVGRTLEVSGSTVRVVGVAPPAFHGPLCCVAPSYWRVEEPGLQGSNARLVAVDVRDRDAFERWLDERIGVSLPGFSADLDHPLARPFGGERGIVGRVLGVLVFLASAVWVTTLLSGANLLLSDTLDRRRELRIRTALGSRGGDAALRILAEAGWLALLGAGVALGLTALLAEIAPWLLPIVGSTSTVRIEVGAEALAVAALAGGASAVLCAVPSAWLTLRLSRRADVDRGPGSSRFAAIGLGIQVSLAGAMLVVTGLFLGSLREFDGEFVGFRNGEVGVHFVTDPDVESGTTGTVLLDHLRAEHPGVGAALTASVPVYGAESDSLTFPDGRRVSTALETVSPSFFDVVGTRLLEGRAARSPGEAVISADLAAELGGGAAALGRTLTVLDTVPVRVTGVVESATWGTRAVRPTVYRGWGEGAIGRAVLLVGAAEGGVSVGRILPALGSLGIALQPFETLDGVLVRSRVLSVFLTRLATALGVAALLVAIGAVHAHFVRWVRARERDLAIRRAVGAPFPRLGRHLVVSALAHIAPGLVIGGFLGWGAGRVVGAAVAPLPEPSALLFGLMALVMIGGSGAALVGPLVRARAIEPLTLLRGE